MKRIAFLLVAVAALTGVVGFTPPPSVDADSDEAASPIYGVKIPARYRDWKLIAVAQLLAPGKGDQLRAQLGNDIPAKDRDYVFTHASPMYRRDDRAIRQRNRPLPKGH